MMGQLDSTKRAMQMRDGLGVSREAKDIEERPAYRSGAR